MQSILKYMLSYSCLASFISMIYLSLFFPSPLSLYCLNTEHFYSMLTDLMLHEEVDWSNTCTLSYVLFVSVIILFCAMMVGLFNLEHLATKLLVSVPFWYMYCDGTPFLGQSGLTVDKIPYPFYPE